MTFFTAAEAGPYRPPPNRSEYKLSDPLPRRIITERALIPLADLPPEQSLGWLNLCAGLKSS